MFSWLKARKKKTNTAKSPESTRLFKSNSCCIKNFNTCFSQNNMIDCENYASEDSEDQTNINFASKTTTDDVKKLQEIKPKKKNSKSALSMSKKEANYSIKCKSCIFFKK